MNAENYVELLRDTVLPELAAAGRNIDPEIVFNLANSANKRINEVLKLNGKVSKY
jgi:hypothetical protein